MATEIIMPQMGESIAEGTITKWLVQVGQPVERDQPLLEISTDKVDAEIPSPVSGVLREVLFAEGETVEVDTVIGYITAAGETAAAKEADTTSPSSAATSRATPSLPENPAEAAAAGARETSRTPDSLADRVRTASSPVVRKIAAEEGVDIADVPGSGIHGRVTKMDILQYLEEQPGERDVSATSPPSDIDTDQATRPRDIETAGSLVTRESTVHSRQVDRPAQTKRGDDGLTFSVPAYTEGERVEIEPMSRVRRLTAAHMLYSNQTSAHVSTVFEIDMSSVVTARNRAKGKFAQQSGTKLTFMPFIFKAVIDGLRSHPKFNASLDGTDIVYKKDINLGMAVAVDWGLLVPVIHNADQLNLVGLARHANDLADRARTKKLQPREVQHGTFTITNPGVFGSLYGVPIINQPQVAILCVGTIEKRPVVITDRDGNDSIAIRSMAYFCLSYDHRLIDGADAEQFMNRMKKTLVQSTWEELDPFTG